MKKRFNKYIELGGLDRKEAEILLPLIPKTDGFKYLRQQIQTELSVRYEYVVECTDCPRKFTVESLTPIPKEKIAEGGICSNCSDDYK